MAPVVSTHAEVAFRAPSQVTEAIALIVDRAKLDRKGVFWSVGIGYRQGNPGQFENTLGFGTPGILLTLLEFYRRTQDSEIGELIRKGGAWVAHRTQTAAFQHGYYGGTTGVWRLFAELEKDFPGLVPEWLEQARTSLAACQRGDHPGNLISGTSGTILGALDALGGTDGNGIQGLLADLLAAAKPCPEGLFWDFNPTSIRAPGGFLQGNAGVDYCFAQLRRQLGLCYPTVVAGSLEYAGGLFDGRRGNWLDQDAADRLRRMQPEEIRKMVEKDGAEKFGQAIQAEDSLGWATGAAGILVSRCAVSAAYRDDSAGDIARENCRRAVQRLNRITEAELAQMDGTLMHGVPGLMLALEGCHSLLPSADFASLGPVLARARSRLDALQPAIEDDDLSLLGGLAGLVYAHLKLGEGEPARNGLIAGPSLSLDVEPTAVPGADLGPFIERRLPAAATVPAVRAALADSAISLRSIAAAAGAVDSSTVLGKSIRHEINLYEVLGGTRFQEHFWRELVKRARFAERYAEGMDDNLLFERFRIDDGLTLLELDFDPYAREALPDGQKLLILRQVTSNGVVEIKLSALQHALVAEFRSPAVVLEVIRAVIRRVETPNVTQRQLADFSCKMIRSFVQSGYLVADSPGKVEAWLLRNRLKETRRNLFPANGIAAAR